MESPNRENNPLFFGFDSSFSPTSSNPSSSVALGRSNRPVPLIADLGVPTRELLESRLCLEALSSG